MKERDVVIDIDLDLDTEIEEGVISADENSVVLSENVGGISPDIIKNGKKEKRISPASAKKPPKPPRPPRGLSLDAADQKLIKELAQLAMMKRARIERMKALKKMKAAKASSSSTGNFIAMVFTVLFGLVFIFQGCHPSEILLKNSSTKSYEEIERDMIAIQLNLSNSGVPLSAIRSDPKYVRISD